MKMQNVRVVWLGRHFTMLPISCHDKRQPGINCRTKNPVQVSMNDTPRLNFKSVKGII